jgi:hypothetical protein
MGRTVVLEDDDTPQGVHFALLCRRSCYNPGTRYNSRGLNSKSSPGNEYEMEQILFRHSAGTLNFSTAVWRRGTVPIHWKSELVSQIADAAIIISEKPYEGIDVYYKRLMDRYNNQPMTILNLLRVKAVHADEGNLTHHYRESLSVVKKMMNLDINMIGFDWHHHLKIHGLDATTDAMWSLVDPVLRDGGVTSGVLRLATSGKITDVKIFKKQNGVIRTNCADSLDRTNLVCFLNSMQYLVDQCRAIGAEQLANVPETSRSLEACRKGIDASLLVHLAEMYVAVGDVCATLFTNTVAMVRFIPYF